MSETVIRSCIDSPFKAEAMQLFENMGSTLNKAIQLCLYQSVAKKCIPFSINMSNATTLKTLNARSA